MKPHGVIEARHRQIILDKGNSMRQRCCSNPVKIVWTEKGRDTIYSLRVLDRIDTVEVCDCQFGCPDIVETCDDEAELPVETMCCITKLTRPLASPIVKGNFCAGATVQIQAPFII